MESVSVERERVIYSPVLLPFHYIFELFKEELGGHLFGDDEGVKTFVVIEYRHDLIHSLITKFKKIESVVKMCE